MISLNTADLSSVVTTAFCMSQPAALVLLEQGSGLSIEGRHAAADTAYQTAVRVPAFLKDTLTGVRAWSPPV